MARQILIHLILLFPITGSDSWLNAQTLKDKIFFSYGVSPTTEFNQADGKSEITHIYELQIGPPPIQITPQLQWIHSLYGRIAEYNFTDRTNQLAAAPSTLYDLQYGMIFIYSLKNPKWSLFASPRIQWRSDFQEPPSTDGLFYSGLFMANYNPDAKDKLVLAFGLAIANDFNKNVLIPIVGVTYYDDRWTIEVVYPRINFLYKPQQQIEWGLTASIGGGIFRTNVIELQDEIQAPYTRTISAAVGHTFNYIVSEKLVLHTCIGYAFVRNYDFMDKNFETIKSSNLHLNPSLFFRTGISIRL